VLTVSQKPEGGGRFRTIREALDNVGPGMIIQVLDHAVYEEYLLIANPTQQRGVVLEAVGKASIRTLPDKREAVWIRDVPGFTLRGFRLESPPGTPHTLVNLNISWSGVILDQLDMATDDQGECVDIHEQWPSDGSAPLVIQNCTMRGGDLGVKIEGSDRETSSHPQPCGQVVIRSNTMVRCKQGVVLRGEVHKVHVVGNRILDAEYCAIDFQDLLPGAADILIANNTMLRCEAAVRIWDDNEKGKDFLKCRNIRVRNNLVFKTMFDADMVFNNHRRGKFPLEPISPCELKELLNSPEWRFSHNWREIDPQKATAARWPGCWIPFRPTDQRPPPNAVGSFTLGDPNFLRPPKGSPLGRGGTGASLPDCVGAVVGGPGRLAADAALTDPALPAYVGAVPPVGVESWDWDKTWKMPAR
jgi:hypothetical protein